MKLSEAESDLANQELTFNKTDANYNEVIKAGDSIILFYRSKDGDQLKTWKRVTDALVNKINPTAFTGVFPVGKIFIHQLFPYKL